MTHPAPRDASVQPGRLPDFLVIGTQKGGTTALYQYLARHPQIGVPSRKELDFFLDGPLHRHPDPNATVGSWDRGIDWYRRWFRTDRPVCGEASPNYTLGIGTERVARRIAEVVPAARIVYLVRNPLDRARSHYLMTMKSVGAHRCSFSEFLRTSHALATSSYGSMIRPYLRLFPRERILVLESARLDADRRESLQTVFRFLAVDERYWCAEYEKRVFVGARRPFVSQRGLRVRDSASLRYLKKRLPASWYYHAENTILRPFRVADPSLALPAGQAADVVARLGDEMSLLRELVGEPLPSLDVSLEEAMAPAAVSDA